MQTNIYYFNFAETSSRKWSDLYSKNQLSLMPISKSSKATFDELKHGDLLAVYRKGLGYHGIARCVGRPDFDLMINKEQTLFIEWVKEFPVARNETNLFKSMIPIVKLNNQSKTVATLLGN